MIGVKPQVRVLEVKHRDRPDDVQPIAWLLFEREETVQKYAGDGSIRTVSITITCKCIAPRSLCQTPGVGVFTAGYSKFYNTVSLISSTGEGGGALFLDLPNILKGHRIGTYMMNEIVSWAMLWPDASIQKIGLGVEQAGEDNKIRRNQFYEQFNIRFEYDADKSNGNSLPMKVADLRTVNAWEKNITEHHLSDYLSAIIHERDTAVSELHTRMHVIESQAMELKRIYQHPFRWALKTLFI